MRVLLMILCGAVIILAGCCPQCPQIPSGALKPLPLYEIQPEISLNTRILYDVKTGGEVGQYFTTGDARKLALYQASLREAAELGIANTAAANKIFEILAAEPKRWWQFWK